MVYQGAYPTKGSMLTIELDALTDRFCQVLTKSHSSTEVVEGQITDVHPFGVDPIADNQQKCSTRMSSFTEYYPSFDLIFHQVVNGNDSIFQEALEFFIDITYRLSST